MALDGFEQAEDPIAALADQIADRVALRLGPQLSRLAAPTDGSPAPELWTARRVASHYGVGISFVYQHAEELGCIRLGGGTCARLRFDPSVVQARWAQDRRRAACRRGPGGDDHDLVERPPAPVTTRISSWSSSASLEHQRT